MATKIINVLLFRTKQIYIHNQAKRRDDSKVLNLTLLRDNFKQIIFHEDDSALLYKLISFMSEVVTLKNADIFQKGSKVLSGVQLSIDAGQFVFLIGKTGRPYFIKRKGNNLCHEYFSCYKRSLQIACRV